MRLRRGVAFVCALGCLFFPASSKLAQAQDQGQIGNPNIAVDYYEPRDPEFLRFYEKLKKRQVLEELAQFLAPVHWPKKLRLIMKQCPAVNNPDAPAIRELIFYNGDEYSLNICYQLFQFLEGMDLKNLDPPPTFVTQQEVVVGGLVGLVLHEAGRAIFDMLDIPILGSEDDAADQIAGFVGQQFDKTTSRTVTDGTYVLWAYDGYLSQANQVPYNYADIASLPMQRAYNTLCIAYGHDPAAFQALADYAKLPQSRAENCADEYRQIEKAFADTLQKDIDMRSMQHARSLTWITPDDLKPSGTQP